MKKDVLNLKNESSVICYIQLLQNNIARMSSQSGIIKASMCVVYTILITIILSIEKMNNFWWIAIVLTIIGAIIDAYYLALEKIYVNKYNDFISNLNFNNVDVDKIYDMKPRNTKLDCELLAMIFTSLKSFSIYGFYIIFIFISILIRFL